ncbi:MAG: hypothetical protein J6Y28_05620 [Acholeplasmatales bacterium]|nr:hypothetical protein [Acholeplasmatales bacterium]
MQRKFTPKTGKERGFQIAGVVLIFIAIPHVIMTAIPVALIFNFIMAILIGGLGFTFLMISMSMIKKRMAAEENGTNKPQVKEIKEPEKKTVDLSKSESPKPNATDNPSLVLKPTNEVVDEQVIKGDVKPNNDIEEDPFEASLKRSSPKTEVATETKGSKKLLAIILPIIILLCIAVIAVTIILVTKNKNNSDDNGGGGSSDKGGGSKATFNISQNTYFEEYPYDGRVDGYLFKPNKEYIQYRFEQQSDDDPTLYVTWVEYGTWTYDSTTQMVHAVCTTYETYDSYFDKWDTNTYPEGATNSIKDFKVISDKMLYWNGNSKFKVEKVTKFTWPLTKYHG